jgi:hypothetical protein
MECFRLRGVVLGKSGAFVASDMSATAQMMQEDKGPFEVAKRIANTAWEELEAARKNLKAHEESHS